MEKSVETSSERKAAMATASPPGLQQPPPLDFDTTSEWPAWILHFDDYRYASGLNERPEEAQVRTLLYTMGRQARDIFATFNLSAEYSKKFELVKKKFDGYFIKESNVVYESACFHKRHQMPGESIDQFMTALHVLADKCDFGEFKQRLIRDRFVVGLRDEKLSESLQMDPKLSLATALARARLKETVQQQQEELRNCNEVHKYTPCKPCEDVNVDAVGYHRKPQRSKETRPTSARSEGPCIFCGGNSHPRTACPARGQRCFNCGLKGHFGKACLKGTSPGYQRKVQVSSVQKDSGEVFLGAVEAPRAKARYVQVLLNSVPVFAKVDSGAEVSVVPASFPGLPTSLEKADEVLTGASGDRLNVLGKFQADIFWRGQTSRQTCYVSFAPCTAGFAGCRSVGSHQVR
ncbi:uncharacterized protein [Dermacentor albipictus]|uniref:uncharacterized protein n=1 Tax=Dermacentor albipictus TaxID=60249 RepID=UPI0038FC7122